MHPWKPWIVLGVLATFAAQAAVIYKWTDPNGLVHYSDQPVPGAEKILTSGSTASGATSASGPAAAPPAKKATAGLQYNQFVVTSPAADQTFFGDEAINVSLTLEPALKPDQTITWHLNGKQLDDQADSTSFSLQGLSRGSYSIVATITDQNSGESQSSSGVSFFVRQPSALSPLHKRP